MRATSESVASEALLTQARWNVILHSTLGVLAAGADARVTALLGDASAGWGAVRIDHALGMTIGWHTDVVLQTRANWLIADPTALGVQATGRRRARVSRWFGDN